MSTYRDLAGAIDMLVRAIDGARERDEILTSAALQHARALARRAKDGLTGEVPWTPFERASNAEATAAQVEALMAQHPGWRESDAHAEVARWAQDEVALLNSRYLVRRRALGRGAVHLAIARRDGLAVHNWDDLQRIKRELLGPECEAVELYPATGREAATGAVCHLWGMEDPEFRFPFGFTAPDPAQPAEPRLRPSH